MSASEDPFLYLEWYIVFVYLNSFLFFINYRSCHNWRPKWGKITPSFITNDFTLSWWVKSTMPDLSHLSPTGSLSQAVDFTHLGSWSTLIWYSKWYLHAQLWQARLLQKEAGMYAGPDYRCSCWLLCLCCCENRLISLCSAGLQCWSSRGKRRGKCWCVDMNGLMVPSKGRHKGSPVC